MDRSNLKMERSSHNHRKKMHRVMNVWSTLYCNTFLHWDWWMQRRDFQGIFLACIHHSFIKRLIKFYWYLGRVHFLHSLDDSVAINAQWETKNKYYHCDRGSRWVSVTSEKFWPHFLLILFAWKLLWQYLGRATDRSSFFKFSIPSSSN